MNEDTSINDTSNRSINSTNSIKSTNSINTYNSIDNYDINTRKRSNTLDISSLSNLNRRKKIINNLNLSQTDNDNNNNLSFDEKLQKLRLKSKNNKIKHNKKNHLVDKLDNYYSNKINDREDVEEDILSDIVLDREEQLASADTDENENDNNNNKDNNNNNDNNDNDDGKLKFLKVNKYHIKSNFQNLLNTSFWSIDQLYVKPGDKDFVIWFFASSYMPLLAGCIGPLSNLLSVGALVSSWKTSKDNPLEWTPDESWQFQFGVGYWLVSLYYH
ncbi:unnamed protein product [[Candida] boidinii]|uniref:Unnamed protein product n=1 Tax=Candida boidinii TaxID=5477 RepID=A0ACB5U5K8_CANBO|nr:unnamed protein product [[Candida] boidinii]